MKPYALLTLPLPTNIANARLHWAQRHRARRKYFEICDLFMAGGERAGVSAPPSQPPEKAKIRITFFLHNKMDEYNLTARAKWIQDWLQTRGYIKSDSPDHLRLLRPRQKVDRKNKRVEIELTVVKQ